MVQGSPDITGDVIKCVTSQGVTVSLQMHKILPGAHQRIPLSPIAKNTRDRLSSIQQPMATFEICIVFFSLAYFVFILVFRITSRGVYLRTILSKN